MTTWQLLAIAAVQGLTEFLPISSSAHLILLPRVLGLVDQGLRFDIAAHLGTFLAAVLYFRADLERLLRSLRPAPGATTEAVTGDRRLLGALAIGTLPVVLAGWWFRDDVASAARSARVVAAASIGFGIVLWMADRAVRGHRTVADVGAGRALVVGLAQALALIPGASRSGTTISAGLFLGLDRDAAARFSFLLSIPVSLAVGVAEVLDLWTVPPVAGELGQLAAVLVVSGVAGYLCIHVFLGWLRRHDQMPFVVYRILLGVAVLAWV